MSNGLSGTTIVSYANRAVHKSKERPRSAFASSKLELPRKPITVNLAPADTPKESTSFYVGVAVGILAVGGKLIRLPTDTEGVIGEIGLDGTIRPVIGVIGMILAGKQHSITTFLLPKANIATVQYRCRKPYISARSYMRSFKVAGTTADLDDSAAEEAHHVK